MFGVLHVPARLNNPEFVLPAGIVPLGPGGGVGIPSVNNTIALRAVERPLEVTSLIALLRASHIFVAPVGTACVVVVDGLYELVGGASAAKAWLNDPGDPAESDTHGSGYVPPAG
jgi:hypothetical protein